MNSKKNSNLKLSTAQSFLRWAGSKKQILPTLEKFWSPSTHKRYVEPFAGSACLFFRLKPDRGMLGDINKDLIATYLEIKYRLDELVEELGKLKKGREHYLSVRGLDTSILTASQRAARFIYLNRFCFNGLYRTNSKGQFNVPYGGERSGDIPSIETLRKCSSILKSAKLVAGDFNKILEMVEPGDFVYLDPPYSVEARRVFKQYNAAVFGDDDLRRLRSWLTKLANHNIDFLVSYADCEEADRLRRGFYYRTINVRRNIAGFTDSRQLSKEIIISSRPIRSVIL
ncbi:MAG: Dam family site-specific DNA-(adenine-N6)-methyltransferase [Acidobacteria bacterium]|nr:Dam family site-specific DNA-(adenine-N6)-methyltransferase [Acidobacteriota bacterium]